MKRFAKAIIAGVVIAAIGVVVLICALGAGSWDFSRADNWEQETFVSDTNFKTLSIEADAGKVFVKRGSTNAVVVNYDYNDKYQPKIEEKGETLRIETGTRKWYDSNNWFNDAPSIEILVNETFSPEIKLELNAGTVEIGDGDWGTLINVELNAGTVSLGDVVVDQIYLDVNAGAFKADKIESVVFSCTISAGSAYVKKLDSKNTTVDVSAGSIKLDAVGSKQDYNIIADKSAGSCNVVSQSVPGAVRFIKVDVSAGSVKINFDN